MLAYTLSDNEFKSSLVSRITVLSLDTSTSGSVDPSRFTPILSRIVTLSRALVVYLA
jgi:hypothetical protein